MCLSCSLVYLLAIYISRDCIVACHLALQKTTKYSLVTTDEYTSKTDEYSISSSVNR
jgi:hypothetical protein